MIPDINESQVAIKLDEQIMRVLDRLAKAGGTNRITLMHIIVSVCLDALDKAELPGHFYINCLQRVKFLQLHMEFPYEHQFTGSRMPTKPIPIKFSDETLFKIDAYMCKNGITRHLLVKTMVIVGIEELKKITNDESYQLDTVKNQLFKAYDDLMNRGYKSFKAFIK